MCIYTDTYIKESEPYVCLIEPNDETTNLVI